jgi:dTDP-4-dehydrorhamnose 3,5-epimerase
VRWDDPAFGIEWPDPANAFLSEKDRNWPDFTG